jgi:hypothetical protein
VLGRQKKLVHLGKEADQPLRRGRRRVDGRRRRRREARRAPQGRPYHPQAATAADTSIFFELNYLIHLIKFTSNYD